MEENKETYGWMSFPQVGFNVGFNVRVARRNRRHIETIKEKVHLTSINYGEILICLSQLKPLFKLSFEIIQFTSVFKVFLLMWCHVSHPTQRHISQDEGKSNFHDRLGRLIKLY